MNTNTEEEHTWPTSPTTRKCSAASARSSLPSRCRAPRRPTPESTWNDLDVDSLDLVEVVKALEDRYEIQIADGRLKSIATVGDAVNLVQELVREKEGVSA